MSGGSRFKEEDAPYRSAIGASLIGAPLAVGGAHVEFNVALAAFYVMLLVHWLVMRMSRGLRINLVGVVLAGALTASVLQIVPLPPGFVDFVAPKTYELWRVHLDNESWATLSLEPPATAYAAMLLLGYACASVLTLQVFKTHQHRVVLLNWVAASGVAVLVLGLAQRLAGIAIPYGTWGSPQNIFVSSFVNPNHLAGFLGFCTFSVIGLALENHGRLRLVWAATAMMCATGSILTFSKGAILSLGIAGAICSVFYGWRESERLRVVWVQAVLGGAALLAAYFAFSQLTLEMWLLGDEHGFAKSRAWAYVPTLVADFPLFGIGRGAFATVFPHYMEGTMSRTFTHLENETLQTLVDWGPWIGGLLLVGGVSSYIRMSQRARSRGGYLGVISAILFLAVHNQGDFSLQVSGVALPAVVVFTAFLGGYRRRRGEKRSRWSAWSRRSGTVMGVVASSLAVLLAYPAVAYTLKKDTDRLENAISVEVEVGVVDEILGRHPVDYLLPLLVAQRHLKLGKPRASLRWTNRAMFLAPASADPHRLAGHALYRLGANGQALNEFRIAGEKSPSQLRSLLRDVWDLSGAEPKALSSLADSSFEFREAAAEFLISKGKYADASRMLEPAVSGDSGVAPTFLLLAATANLRLGDLDHAWKYALRLEDRAPAMEETYAIQASVHERRGDYGAAFEALDRGVAAATTKQTLLSRKGNLLLKEARYDEARAVAQQLLELSGTRHWLAQSHLLFGKAYEAEGAHSRALRSYQRARDVYPTSVSPWLQVARIESLLGRPHIARKVLLQARIKVGENPHLERAIANLSDTQ